MARVTVEDCLKNVDSRFSLVHLAVRRVLQLRGGVPLTIGNTKGNKEVVMALREIAAERITIDNIREIEEARPAPVEPVLSAPETAELKEIIEEAVSFGPAVELGSEGLSDLDMSMETDRPADEADEEEV